MANKQPLARPDHKTLPNLPHEIIEHIMHYTDPQTKLTIVSMLSKRLHHFIETPKAWTTIKKVSFNTAGTPGKSASVLAVKFGNGVVRDEQTKLLGRLTKINRIEIEIEAISNLQTCEDILDFVEKHSDTLNTLEHDLNYASLSLGEHFDYWIYIHFMKNVIHTCQLNPHITISSIHMRDSSSFGNPYRFLLEINRLLPELKTNNLKVFVSEIRNVPRELITTRRMAKRVSLSLDMAQLGGWVEYLKWFNNDSLFAVTLIFSWPNGHLQFLQNMDYVCESVKTLRILNKDPESKHVTKRMIPSALHRFPNINTIHLPHDMSADVLTRSIEQMWQRMKNNDQSELKVIMPMVMGKDVVNWVKDLFTFKLCNENARIDDCHTDDCGRVFIRINRVKGGAVTLILCECPDDGDFLSD